MISLMEERNTQAQRFRDFLHNLCHWDITISRVLCDLAVGMSLLPHSICKRLQAGEPKPTQILIQLADRSVKCPIGFLWYVPLQVGKFFISCEDAQVPIILGRPFLATTSAIIDVNNGRLLL